MSTAATITAAVAQPHGVAGQDAVRAVAVGQAPPHVVPDFRQDCGPVEAAAVLSTSLLAWRKRRERPDAFQSTAVAAACLGAAHVLFWVVVQPVTVEVGAMVAWRDSG